MIFDAHAHLTPTFSAEALLRLMDGAGVERAVLLQGPYYGDMDAKVAEACGRWQDRFVGAFAPDPRARDLREAFKRCVDDLELRIVKFELSEATGYCGRYPDLKLDSEALRWMADEARRHALTLTFDLGAVGSRSYQTDRLAQLARAYPDLTFVIAHLGQPPIADAGNADLNTAWTRQIRLGELPNVSFDTSALPAYGYPAEGYPFKTAATFARRAIDMIGAESILWGTDAPGLLEQGSYVQLLDYLRDGCNHLTAAERDSIFGGNASRVYFGGG